MASILIFILIVGSILFLGLGIFTNPMSYLKLRDVPTPGEKRKFKLKLDNQALGKLFKPLGFVINPVTKKLTYIQKLKTQTEILRIELDIPVLIGLKLMIMVAFGFLGFKFLFPVSPFYPVLAIFIGFFLPDYLMWQKIKKKKEDIVRCFPETVDLLHMCINAGADLLSAIKWVIGKSTGNPFIEQLSIVLSEVQVGKPRAEAIKDMSKRLQLPDIASFSRTIVQAERMGTPVEEAFSNLSEDTRNRRYQNGERYAIKASLKILFPLIFCILPAIMIIVAGPIIIKFSQGDLMPSSF